MEETSKQNFGGDIGAAENMVGDVVAGETHKKGAPLGVGPDESIEYEKYTKVNDKMEDFGVKHDRRKREPRKKLSEKTDIPKKNLGINNIEEMNVARNKTDKIEAEKKMSKNPKKFEKKNPKKNIHPPAAQLSSPVNESGAEGNVNNTCDNIYQYTIGDFPDKNNAAVQNSGNNSGLQPSGIKNSANKNSGNIQNSGNMKNTVATLGEKELHSKRVIYAGGDVPTDVEADSSELPYRFVVNRDVKGDKNKEKMLKKSDKCGNKNFSKRLSEISAGNGFRQHRIGAPTQEGDYGRNAGLSDNMYEKEIPTFRPSSQIFQENNTFRPYFGQPYQPAYFGAPENCFFPVDNPDFAGNPSFPGNHPDFPGNNPYFPGNNPNFPGNNPDFAGNDPDFPGNNPNFAGNNPNFAGNNPNFPGNFGRNRRGNDTSSYGGIGANNGVNYGVMWGGYTISNFDVSCDPSGRANNMRNSLSGPSNPTPPSDNLCFPPFSPLNSMSNNAFCGLPNNNFVNNMGVNNMGVNKLGNSNNMGVNNMGNLNNMGVNDMGNLMDSEFGDVKKGLLPTPPSYDELNSVFHRSRSLLENLSSSFQNAGISSPEKHLEEVLHLAMAQVKALLVSGPSNLSQGIEGPDTSAPTMLAHPEEFVNPSSFLRVYGFVNGCETKGRKKKKEDGKWTCLNCTNTQNTPQAVACNQCKTPRGEKADQQVADCAKRIYQHYMHLYKPPHAPKKKFIRRNKSHRT